MVTHFDSLSYLESQVPLRARTYLSQMSRVGIAKIYPSPYGHHERIVVISSAPVSYDLLPMVQLFSFTAKVALAHLLLGRSL